MYLLIYISADILAAHVSAKYIHIYIPIHIYIYTGEHIYIYTLICVKLATNL